MATRNDAGRSKVSRFGFGVAALGLLATILSSMAPSEAEAQRRRYGGHAPAYAALVMDANTGRVLHAENADAHRFPASITKVMTLYMLFEQIEAGRFNLQSPLRVSEEAASQPPSKINVRAGGTITVEEAIRALVTKSANDVAVVVAENIAGDEERFAQLMTRKARAIGMSRTTFRNASGLPDAEQVTTARDLVTLGRSIQDRFPRYWRYFQTFSFAYRGVNHRNHNRLLGRVQGVDGIKTGYTRASGFNLLSSARRGDRQVIAVVMGGRTGGARDARMRQLLEAHFPQAYAGRRTAPLVIEARDATPTRVQAIAQAPLPGRRQPVTAPVPPTPMAVAAVAAGQTQASTGASAAAPVTAVAQVQRPVIRQESAPPPVAASAYAPGNPNPRPGVLGTIPASQLTTATIPQRPAQAVAAVPPAPAPATTRPPVQMAQAEAETPRRRGEFSIQLGAFPSESAARDTLKEARDTASNPLRTAEPYTEKVERGALTLIRARFAGFDRAGAEAACRALRSNDYDCMLVRN